MDPQFRASAKALGRSWYRQGFPSHNASGVGCPDPLMKGQPLAVRLEWFRGYMAESFGVSDVFDGRREDPGSPYTSPQTK